MAGKQSTISQKKINQFSCNKKKTMSRICFQGYQIPPKQLPVKDTADQKKMIILFIGIGDDAADGNECK